MRTLGCIIALGGIKSRPNPPASPDDITETYITSYQGSTPIVGAEAYGDLLSIKCVDATYNMLQIYLTASTGILYYRVKQDSVWLNWFKITGTAVQQ